MDFQKKDKNFFKYLAKEIKSRDNPTDLKEVAIGFVASLEPVTVTTDGGAFTFTENNNLFISEQFRLRCNIDKTTALSSDVPNLLSEAKQVTETHSYSGSPCNMPQAVTKLARYMCSKNQYQIAFYSVGFCVRFSKDLTNLILQAQLF